MSEMFYGEKRLIWRAGWLKTKCLRCKHCNDDSLEDDDERCRIQNNIKIDQDSIFVCKEKGYFEKVRDHIEMVRIA